MLVLQAGCSRFNTMADGSGRLQFDTQELTPEQFSQIGEINKKQGVLVFKPDVEEMPEEQLKEIREYKSSGLGDKKKRSKSQVLRAVLFKKWEKDGQGFKNQEDHYNHYMDQVITHFKGLIDEE